MYTTSFLYESTHFLLAFSLRITHSIYIRYMLVEFLWPAAIDAHRVSHSFTRHTYGIYLFRNWQLDIDIVCAPHLVCALLHSSQSNRRSQTRRRHMRLFCESCLVDGHSLGYRTGAFEIISQYARIWYPHGLRSKSRHRTPHIVTRNCTFFGHRRHVAYARH